MNDDIIAAVATSRLEAAISIIRVSGKDCIAFVQSFFSGNLTNKKSNTTTMVILWMVIKKLMK